MPASVPIGTQILCPDDSLVLKLYRRTNKLRKSNLVLPDTHHEEMFFGRIVNIGRGRFVDFMEDGVTECRTPVSYKVGDDAIFARYHGERISIGGVMHVIMRINDLLAKIILPPDAAEFFTFDEEVENEALAKAAII